VLQEREVERVGGKRPVALDIRVLATSNRDMVVEVKAGRFREDLYYRLNVFPLAIPALRERSGDILPLARHFLAMHGNRAGRAARFDPRAEAKLAACDWPGNVRELENAIQRAVIMAPTDLIGPDHLSSAMPAGVPASPPSLVEATIGATSSASPANIKDLERQHILETLAKVGGSRKKAVELLGISERTLRYKLAQYRQDGEVGTE
jgi:two-component system response regulator FlrC